MKPLLSESQDNQSLEALGRASIQIVHDLKNQLNGLKLYATFLRKRMEKSGRPEDEMETVGKLISGLDRTAGDLSMIVKFGQPIELRRRPQVDLQKILRDVAVGLNERPRVSGALVGPIVVNSETNPLLGEFDAELIAEALKSISLGAMALSRQPGEGPLEVSLKGETMDSRKEGVIEWGIIIPTLDHDPFHSFAGSDEIRMSFAAKIIEAHGGSAARHNGSLRVRLPLTA